MTKWSPVNPFIWRRGEPGVRERKGPRRQVWQVWRLYYNGYIDKTIRNIDARAYRALKSLAASEGKTLGQVITEAIQAYTARPPTGTTTLADLKPEDLGPGTETWSGEVDRLVYGS